MKRKEINNTTKDKKIYSQSARKIKAMNVKPTNPRGGIRL